MVKSSKSVKKYSRKHLSAAIKRRHKLKPMKNAIRRKQAAARPGMRMNEKEDGAEELAVHSEPLSNTQVESLAQSSDEDEDLEWSDDDLELDVSEEEQDGAEKVAQRTRLWSEVEKDHARESSEEDEEADDSGLPAQNKRLRSEVEVHKRQLERLKEKDPEFYKFLKEHDEELLEFDDEENEGSDGTKDWEGNQSEPVDEEDSAAKHEISSMQLSTTIVDEWCVAVKEKKHVGALRNLLQAFRSACHYGDGEGEDLSSKYNIANSHVFNRIMLFVLSEMDGVLKTILGISDHGEKKASEKDFGVLEVQKIGRWKRMEPFVKTYLGNALHILNQMTDNQMISFTLRRLKPSVLFLSAFPKLARKYLKVALHFWGSGEGALPVIAFIFIREMAIRLGPESLDLCLKGIYKEYTANSKFVNESSVPRIHFMASCVVELYGLNLNVSYQHVFVFIRQIAIILRNALTVKTKDAFKNVYCWQYMNSLSLWVKVLCAYTSQGDLQPLAYPLAQILGGVARLVPTVGYFPLRLQCAKLLNQLAAAGKTFIPVAALLLDMLQFKELHMSPTGVGKAIDFEITLKTPKSMLKTRAFQDECVSSVIHQLAEHLAMWSYAIAFPELAVVPLLQLRRFVKSTTVDRFRRQMKQLMDQIEQNLQFVESKRDGVTFSPKDISSVSTFLKEESESGTSPLSQLIVTLRQRAEQRRSNVHKTSELVGEQGYGLSIAKVKSKVTAAHKDSREEDEEDGEKVFSKDWLPSKKAESTKSSSLPVKGSQKPSHDARSNEEEHDVLEDLLLSSDDEPIDSDANPGTDQEEDPLRSTRDRKKLRTKQKQKQGKQYGLDGDHGSQKEEEAKLPSKKRQKLRPKTNKSAYPTQKKHAGDLKKKNHFKSKSRRK